VVGVTVAAWGTHGIRLSLESLSHRMAVAVITIARQRCGRHPWKPRVSTRAWPESIASLQLQRSAGCAAASSNPIGPTMPCTTR
jgi:hypothetical protein